MPLHFLEIAADGAHVGTLRNCCGSVCEVFREYRMQVLFTIELRVDCEADKCRLAKHAVRQAALQLYSRAALWDGGSEVTAYSQMAISAFRLAKAHAGKM